jgi:hypothetical protein
MKTTSLTVFFNSFICSNSYTGTRTVLLLLHLFERERWSWKTISEPAIDRKNSNVLCNMSKYSSKLPVFDSMSSIASESRGSNASKNSVIVYLDENGNQCKEPRVRKVVGTHARQVTVTNSSRRHRESHSRTQHFVTSIRCVNNVIIIICVYMSNFFLVHEKIDPIFKLPFLRKYATNFHAIFFVWLNRVWNLIKLFFFL